MIAWQRNEMPVLSISRRAAMASLASRLETDEIVVVRPSLTQTALTAKTSTIGPRKRDDSDWHNRQPVPFCHRLHAQEPRP